MDVNHNSQGLSEFEEEEKKRANNFRRTKLLIGTLEKHGRYPNLEEACIRSSDNPPCGRLSGKYLQKRCIPAWCGWEATFFGVGGIFFYEQK